MISINMLYDDFKPVVDLLLNNWTALQLAVEHGMGAPGGKQTAQLMSVYITRYCVENVVDRDDLAEVLEDLMDEEFDTACHDNSPKDVAGLLVEFLALLKEGRHAELRSLIEAMPKCQLWLSQPIQKSAPPQSHGNPDDDTTSSGTDDDDDNSSPMNGHHQVPSQFGQSTSSTQESEPMDEDPEPEPGWTTVRTRRKK